MKRSMTIALLALGTGAVSLNTSFTRADCDPDDPVLQTQAEREACRQSNASSRSHGGRSSRSSDRSGSSSSKSPSTAVAAVSHGGFGGAGAAHAGGGG